MQSFRLKLEEAFLVALFAAGFVVLYVFSQPLFFGIAELFPILLLGASFIVFWQARDKMQNDYFIYLMTGLLFTSLINLFRFFAFPGINLIPGGVNVLYQLWVSAKLVQSWTMCLAPVFLRRKVRLHLILVEYSVASILLVGSVVFWRLFPDCYLPDSGYTSFFLVAEALIISLFLGAVAHLWIRRKLIKGGLWVPILAPVLLYLAAEVAFILPESPEGIGVTVSTFLRIIAAYTVYRTLVAEAIIDPYNVIFKDLTESETRYRRLLDTLPTAVLVVDPSDRDYRIESINPSAKVIEGTQTDLIKRPMRDLLPEADFKEISEILERVKETGSPEDTTLRGSTRDGRDIWRNLYVYRLPDGELVVVYQDVSAQKTYEATLETLHWYSSQISSAETINKVAEMTYLGAEKLISFDYGVLGLVEDGYIKATHHSGVKADELPKAGIPLEGKAICVRAVKEGVTQIVSDVSKDGEYRMVPVTGPPPLSELAVPIGRGSPLGVLVLYDIRVNAFTEREKRIAETLTDYAAASIKNIQQKEKLREEENKKARELVEGARRVSNIVRFDLKGPMQAIKNALFLIQRDPQRTTEMTKTISDSVDYASQILDDLGRSNVTRDIQKKLVNLSDIVESCLDALSIPENVTVTRNYRMFQAATVDASRIKRAVDNILRNALEAMPNGGQLSVSIVQDESRVEIVVSDTGVGIKPENINAIFAPFWTTKEGAAGMGLPYVKQVVEAHDGSVTVESREGEGTTFIVMLPVKGA